MKFSKELFANFQPTSVPQKGGMLAFRIRRKQFYTLDNSLKLPGCFDDTGYDLDCTLSILAVILEFIGLSILYAKSHNPVLVYILLFTVFVDVISAVLLHGSKGKQNIAENNAFVNNTTINRRKARNLKIFGAWGNVPLGFILLWVCAILKASYAFGVTRTLGPAIGIGLAVVYIVIAYIYQFHTGNAIAGWWFRHNVIKEYENYEQAIKNNQPINSKVILYKITPLNFTQEVKPPEHNILIYKTNSQEIKHGIGQNANGNWILQTWGYLFDTDISSLLSELNTNTQQYLLKVCINTQLQVLQSPRASVAYNPNELIQTV